MLNDKVTDEVNAIVSRLSAETPQLISGFREDVLRIIEPDEIKSFFQAAEMFTPKPTMEKIC